MRKFAIELLEEVLEDISESPVEKRTELRDIEKRVRHIIASLTLPEDNVKV